MLIFSRVIGMSTTGRSMRLALRMRVSMSETGSVIMVASSPARFFHARDQPVAGHVTEANPADAKLAIDGAGTPAQSATQPNANLVARPQFYLVRVLLVGFQLRHLLLEFRSFRSR